MVWLIIIVGVSLIIGGVIYLLYFYEKSDPDIRERLDNLHNRYDPNITPASARRETKRSEARTALVSQVGSEARAVTSLVEQKTEAESAIFRNEHITDQLGRSEQLSQQQHEHDLDNLVLQRNLISYAERQGMDVNTYLEVLKTRSLNKVEMERIEDEAKARLKGGFVYQLHAYQKLGMLRGVLDHLYEQSYLLETSNEPEPVKRRKLAQVEEDIRLHEEDIGARRKRLLSAFDEEDTEGSDEDPDDSGHA